MRVRRSVLEAIIDHAHREFPRECCGLLIGDGDGIAEAVATENVAADPLRRFEVAPRDHFEQIRRCRARVRDGVGLEAVVGAYHSHPRSAPEPSATDAELACEEFLYLIAGPADGTAPAEVRAFRFRQAAFEPVTLLPVDDTDARHGE